MKKVLSLVLVLSMVLGSFGFAFAGAEVRTTTATQAGEMLKELGLLVGDNGDLMLGKDLKRQDMMVMLSRLLGAEEEAEKYPLASNYSDVRGAYYQSVIGWAQAKGLTTGMGDGTFGFDGKLELRHTITFLLRALGYDSEYAWANHETLAVELGFVAAGTDLKATTNRGVMSQMVVNALYTPMFEAKHTLGTHLELVGFEGEVEVELAAEVKANTAKSFQVTLTKAVEDIKITAKRGTTAVNLTTKWNDAKTVATLEASSKLAEGIYTITVGELGEFNVEITKEKIASVEFDSEQILRINDTQGIVGYVVRNQYGEDVTDASLGRGLDWIVSTQSYRRDPKAGVIEVTHNVSAVHQLKDLKTVVITARDTSTGFVSTKNLTVSETVGIINDVKLLGLVDEDGKEVEFTHDATKAYYLAYEVRDVNGKEVDYYSALVATSFGQNVLDVRSSNDSLVTVTPERHPKNQSKYALRVEVVGTMTFDTPVSFIAIAPFTGKSYTLNTTLKRRSQVDKFTLQVPSEEVSVNRTVEIPFTAYDQKGEAITRFEDLNGRITFNPADLIGFRRQADGTAKLMAAFPNDRTYYITATVNDSLTGSFSQISINVKEAAVPTSIQPLRHTRAYTTGSSWSRRISNLTIRDQFDRSMNLRTDAYATGYYVVVESSNSATVGLRTASTGAVTNSVTISGETAVHFVGGSTFGTSTITYKLMKTGEVDPIDTASTVVYNVNANDIRSVKAVTDHSQDLYMTTVTTGAYANMKNGVTMVGLLNNDMEVRLPSSMIHSYTRTDNRFNVSTSGGVRADGAFGTDTTATTTVTGYVYGRDGVLSASVNITAKSAAPAPKAVTVSYSNLLRRNGIDRILGATELGINVDTDIVEVRLSDVTTLFNTKSIFGYDTTGASHGVDAAPFQFWVDTNYGDVDSGILSNVIVTRTRGTGTLVVNSTNGRVDTTGVLANDEYTITALAANGMSKTVVLKVLPSLVP